jgi:integrase
LPKIAKVLRSCATQRILDDAVHDRMLTSNPARGVKPPPRTPHKNVYLTADQLNRLASEAGRYRSLVSCSVSSGLRLGEAAALRVSDVDFLPRRVILHTNAVKVGGDFGFVVIGG